MSHYTDYTDHTDHTHQDSPIPSDILLGSLLIGTSLGNDGGNRPDLKVFCDSPLFRPHRDKPWFQAYLQERHQIPPTSGVSATSLPSRALSHSGAVRIPVDTFRYHGLLSGSTGGGKTRLALHLLTEQLKRGCSLVAIDPKEETLFHLTHCAHKAGFSEEQIVTLLPSHKGVGCPGWNPLDFRASGVPAYEAVSEFVKLIEASSPSWGARMADLMKNAARLAAYHDLSLHEMVAILRDDEYREALLQIDPPQENVRSLGDRIAFEETRGYFAGEFASWSASRRAEAVDPVLNKVRTLLDIPFFRALLCAKKSTLDLPSLWHGTKPRVLLVHLDFRALGSDGAMLLAGLLSYHLFQTALRVGTHAPRSVILYLDELGIQERFVGSAIRDILAMARSFHLRLLVACQHLGQLSPELKQALLTVAFRAFFRLGPEDAKAATTFLASLTPHQPRGTDISRVSIDVYKGGSRLDPPVMEKAVHRVQDMHGSPVSVPQVVWDEFQRFVSHQREQAGETTGILTAFRMLLSRVARVYVRSPLDKSAYEIEDYLRGVPQQDIAFTGPDPLKLVVRFPRPKVTILERVTDSDRQQGWVSTLMSLKEREAAVVTPECGARLIKVLPVELPEGKPRWERYLRQGQSEGEIERIWQGRRNQMKGVIARTQAAGGEETGEAEQAAQGVASSSRSQRANTSQSSKSTKPLPVPQPAARAERTPYQPLPVLSAIPLSSEAKNPTPKGVKPTKAVKTIPAAKSKEPAIPATSTAIPTVSTVPLLSPEESNDFSSRAVHDARQASPVSVRMHTVTVAAMTHLPPLPPLLPLPAEPEVADDGSL